MLSRGHNSDYWIKKIERNMSRDLYCSRKLRAAGWAVLRFWESDIHKNTAAIADLSGTKGHQFRLLVGQALASIGFALAVVC